MTFNLKSIWKRVGWLEKACALVLAVYLILIAMEQEGVLTALLGFTAFVLSAWLLLRVARIGVRKFIWRLRNRLIVAYLLIAVIPILLILTLAGLGTYMLADQVAVYLVRSELDRRVDAMRSATNLLMQVAPGSRTAKLQSTGEIYGERHPGIAFLIARGETRQRWPADAAIDLPTTPRGSVGGIVWRDGRYYAWSLAVQDDAQVLAMDPLSRKDLSALVPGLGDVYFVQISTDAKQTAKSGLQIQPAERDTASPALPPAVNSFDLDVFWPSLVIVADWLDPAKQRPAFLLVHTRLSAVLTVILSQKADELQGQIGRASCRERVWIPV